MTSSNPSGSPNRDSTPPDDGETREGRLSVHFSDACSDVLVFLAAANEATWYTSNGVAIDVAPADAADALETTGRAIRTLHECGLVEGRPINGIPMWRITAAGRTAVAEATR